MDIQHPPGPHITTVASKISIFIEEWELSGCATRTIVFMFLPIIVSITLSGKNIHVYGGLM